MHYKRKKIWLNRAHSKYCIVKLFANRKDMQAAYKQFRPDDTGHKHTLGAHCGYEKVKVEPNGGETLCQETGLVFLHFNACGAGFVAHEFLHAVLWAWHHRNNKSQYPVIICNMEEEEELLHNLTYAIKQFYTWYWKIEKDFIKQ